MLLIFVSLWLGQGGLTLAESIENISNDDIRWEGTFVGLAPTVLNEKAKGLLETGEKGISALLKALSDPEKFIAAHVLLTQMTGVEYETTPTWNGLSVDMEADDSVNISSDQRFVLENRWRKWYQASPRPQQLPDAD